MATDQWQAVDEAGGGNRLKVATIVGTRPEIIKLSRVIAELDRHTEHVLIHSGQNYDYELNEIFFEQLGIRRPDHFLAAAGTTAAETIGAVIARGDTLLRELRPDAVLLYGDTNSCLVVLAAKRLKIPVFHMEAGNRCFDQRVPEEINRKVVDHLSDVNMTLTEHARRYLIAEGLKPELTFNIGSSMPEVLAFHRPQIDGSDVLARLGLTPGQYLVLSSHREENVDLPERRRSLFEAMRALVREYDRKIVVSTHPRMRRFLTDDDLSGLEGVDFIRPLGFIDYVRLQNEAFCVLSDSGTITEESALLGFPAVMIRDAHERPEGVDAGTLVMSGVDAPRIVDSVRVVTAQHEDALHDRVPQPRPPLDYAPADVSRKVVRIILSYTGYINRTVWFR